MEPIYADGTPLAAYLEGEGSYDPSHDSDVDHSPSLRAQDADKPTSFAPSSALPAPASRLRRKILPPIHIASPPNTRASLTQFHNAWSTAVNSRLGAADNAKFLEHFRYTLVASQLLNEYLDQGSLPPPTAISSQGADGVANEPAIFNNANSLYGAAATAGVAFAAVWLIHWARSAKGGYLNKGRVTFVMAVFALLALVGYAYVRKQWVKYLRQQAVGGATELTTNWQAFEISSTSALQFIQEVELVSKGYRLSTPLPPVSRLEDSGPARRCARLRKMLHKSYASLIPACIAGISTLRTLINEDDLDRYFDIYDINSQDAQDASGPDALSVLEDDAESLKSLRVLGYRASILRRVFVSGLMSLEADGGKPDFTRWHTATELLFSLSSTLASSADKIQSVMAEMETLNVPTTPVIKSPNPGQARDNMRSQVRKISALSSGIRSLQAKMQVLREETNRSIESSDDLTDLGPNLMAQYDSIGTDLKDLMQAWETGKASLQSNISRQEKRLSFASNASGLRSPVSSLGGLTAVDEDGSPMNALKLLSGDGDGMASNRSSLGTSPSEEGEAVFEAIAMPKKRSSLTREERITQMNQERERRTSLMARREANTSMMKELENVITLRPKKGVNGSTRITSI
ncbi:hypothetical protein WHR41_05119 [Cladosporium halotolerans]|uniref:Vezatin n=1 Tax=Cladosporium halotolerans TaxID=1052096 RepID=A0AB34KM09_9PEZI